MEFPSVVAHQRLYRSLGIIVSLYVTA